MWSNLLISFVASVAAGLVTYYIIREIRRNRGKRKAARNRRTNASLP